jgi:hypothetical protein
MNTTTAIQDETVNKLLRMGFEENATRADNPDESEACTVYMSKRVKSYSTRYVEVDSNGLCNGLPFAQWKAGFVKG